MANEFFMELDTLISKVHSERSDSGEATGIQ